MHSNSQFVSAHELINHINHLPTETNVHQPVHCAALYDNDYMIIKQIIIMMPNGQARLTGTSGVEAPNKTGRKSRRISNITQYRTMTG